MGLDSLLKLSGINKWYDGLHALQDVSVEIGRGEIVALVGDNGAGKSTLVKVISGAERPDKGQLFVEGSSQTITSPKDAGKLGIATLHQSLGLVGTLNVFENIFLGREEIKKFGPIRVLDKAKMRARAINLLSELSIDIPRLNVPVTSMSGGQRQCIALSRLLLNEVKLILMDEPMAALGVVEGRRVLDLIESLRAKGVTVLIISHNLEHVFTIADRIVVLKNGRLVGAVSPTEVSRSDVVNMITTGESLATTGVRQ